jgi:hypothetical protein
MKIKTDFLTKLFSQIAFMIHPKLGLFYDSHARFLNDGFVELICLLIGDGFVMVLSYYFVGLTLAVILTATATPFTYSFKYLMHKYWVWKPKEAA